MMISSVSKPLAKLSMINTKQCIDVNMIRLSNLKTHLYEDRHAEAIRIVREIRKLLKQKYVVDYFKKKNMRFNDVYISEYRYLYFVYLTHGQSVTYNSEYFLSFYLDVEFNRPETIHNITKDDK